MFDELNSPHEKSLTILITAISVIFGVDFSCVEFSCVMFSCVELSCVAFSCVEFSGNPVPAVLLCVQLSLYVRTSLELYLLSRSQSSLLNAAELFKKRFSLVVVVISLEFECNGKLWYSNINRFCNFDMFRNFVKNSNPMCDVALSM